MNIKEILNYRNTCPICSEPLSIKSEASAYKATVQNNELKIEIGRIAPKRNVRFLQDGTFKANTFFDAHPNYISDITIKKYCGTCFIKGKSTDFHAGFMSIGRLCLRGYYYTFRCKIQDGTYIPSMIRELLCYRKDKSLYSMDNHFEEDKMCLSKFTNLDTRWGLELKPKLMESHTADSVVELIKNYMIFS